MIQHMLPAMTRMLVLSLVPILVIPTHAQKQERVCVVVARVNGDPITQQDYLSALRDYRTDFSWQMEMKRKNQREIDAELERKKPSLLDDLIDELLLAQRGKELGFSADVEMKRLNEIALPGYHDVFPQLEDDLRKQGIDVEQARTGRRMQALGHRAIQMEVFEPVFHSIADSERRDFYENHKEDFMLPATVTLSEVFLPFLGNAESRVEQRAVKLLAELRSGADFFKAVAENTPTSRPSCNKRGSLGSFRLDELKQSVVVDIAKLNPGEFTEPTRLDDGYNIIRLDGRKPVTLRSYEDPMTQSAVSRAITMRRAAEIRKSYTARLREKARIEICPVR